MNGLLMMLIHLSGHGEVYQIEQQMYGRADKQFFGTLFSYCRFTWVG